MKNLKQQYQKQTYMCNTQERQLYSPFSFQKNITAIIAATIGIPYLNPTVWTTHDEEVVWTKKKRDNMIIAQQSYIGFLNSLELNKDQIYNDKELL